MHPRSRSRCALRPHTSPVPRVHRRRLLLGNLYSNSVKLFLCLYGILLWLGKGHLLPARYQPCHPCHRSRYSSCSANCCQGPSSQGPGRHIHTSTYRRRYIIANVYPVVWMLRIFFPGTSPRSSHFLPCSSHPSPPPSPISSISSN